DIHPPLLRQPGDNVAIATIVAAPTEQGQGTNARPAPQKMTESRAPGAHHQLEARNTHGFDGETVQLPDLIGAIEPHRERVSHSGRRSGRSPEEISPFHASRP